MSYEGYVQRICENGHRYDTDAMSDTHMGDGLCPFCGAASAFENHVDETNCDSIGFVTIEDWERFIIEPEETQTCDLGHIHITKDAVYRVPTTEELAPLRRYYDPQTKGYLPLQEPQEREEWWT